MQIGSFLLVAVLVLSGFTAGTSAAESANQINATEFNVTSAGLFLLPKTNNTEWCTVYLNNPRSSLNVRNSNGRVVTKLRHGTAVYVDSSDGGFSRVSVKKRGRLVILGWAASEFLSC